MSTEMTPDQEYELYADPSNQEPQGPPVRRRQRMGAPIPVRLPDDVRREVDAHAAADGRSLSSWIRRAVEHELARDDGKVSG